LFDSGQRGIAAFLEQEINMLLFLQVFFKESGYFAGFHLPRYALNCFPTKSDFQFKTVLIPSVFLGGFLKTE
jgi:hypothetical protein